MKSQEKRVVMVTMVVQKVLSVNITVNMLLGVKSWVLNQLKLSTTIKGGILVAKTIRGRRYRSQLESILSYLYSQANLFYGWGSAVGEYTYSLLQYGNLLKEKFQVVYFPEANVVQLQLPVVENGVTQINAFNFVSEDYPHFLFREQEVIRLKGMEFSNLVSKLDSMTFSLDDDYYKELPLRFRYNYIVVFNNKQFPVD